MTEDNKTAEQPKEAVVPESSSKIPDGVQGKVQESVNLGEVKNNAEKETEKKKSTGIWGAIKASFFKFALNFFLAKDVIDALDGRRSDTTQTDLASAEKSVTKEKDAQETSVATAKTEKSSWTSKSSAAVIDSAVQGSATTQQNAGQVSR